MAYTGITPQVQPEVAYLGGQQNLPQGNYNGLIPAVKPVSMQYGGVQQTLTPAYGLAGANQQLQQNWNTPASVAGGYGAGGYSGNISSPSFSADYNQVNANRDMAMQQSAQGIQALQGYAQPGQQATAMQANLSGANGVQAQQQAYNNFQNSPGQQWLVDQAERGLTRNAAAIGGLGGGNVRQALQRQAMGLAQQDYQNQFNNLGAVGDRGIQASSLQTGLRDSAGGYASNAGSQAAGLQSSAMGASSGVTSSMIGANASLANNRLNAQGAYDIADLASKTQLARDRGQYAYGAGQDISQNIGGTTSALANLQNEGGINQANNMGTGASYLASILQGGGANAQTLQTDLAKLLGGYQTGQAATVNGQTSVGQFYQPSNFQQNWGNALNAGGNALNAYANYQQTQSPAGDGLNPITVDARRI